MDKKKLYLIDATAFCYRAFFALKGLTTSFGQPTNAIYGFVNMLNKILKEKRSDYLAVCFDVSRDTFRKKKFAEYKMNRPSMPEELASQIALIKKVVSAYGITIYEKEGFEADDIIAAAVKKAKSHGFSVVIISSDKDILQLVDDQTKVLSPHKDEDLLYDRKKVIERFGVEPEKISDIVALMGDAADNIPGVPGIGEKTASALIKEFGSLNQLLNNLDQVKQEKSRNAIKTHLEQINLSKELVVLDESVDLEFEPENLRLKTPDYKELLRLFKYLEFKRLIKELPLEDDNRDLKIEVIEDSRLNEIISEKEPLFFYGLTPETLTFGFADKLFQVKSGQKNLEAILSNEEIKKNGHDLKKSKVFLARLGINLCGLHFDTMVAAYLLNPSSTGFSLRDISLEYSDNPLFNSDISGVAAVRLIKELKPKLIEQLRQKQLEGLFTSLEMPLVEVLAEMEICGIKLDTAVIEQISQDIEGRLVKLVEQIYNLCGCQFNINSPKQLREVLFERLKLPVVKRSKTGPSTDEEVLRKLAKKHELPAFLLEYRQLTKLKNTYIDTLPKLIDKHTGRIHTSFNQTQTETGRLSSSEPNLQNIPVKSDIGRSLRAAIVALSKDSLLLSCDYSQIELRILAHLSKDENLIEAFKENKDIHKITASLIYSIEERDVTEQMRDLAKRVNFGIVYGLTAYGLSRDLGISPEEAQNFIEAYFLRYPKVRDYIEKQIEKAERDGFVTTLLGRKRFIPEIKDKNTAVREFAKRKAVNTPIQGTASDLIKLAMVNIDKEIKKRQAGIKMILQIHDELIFDTPEKELKDSIALIRQGMEEVLELEIPIKVEIKKGKNWLEMEEVR